MFFIYRQKKRGPEGPLFKFCVIPIRIRLNLHSQRRVFRRIQDEPSS